MIAACVLRENGVNAIILDAASQPSTISRAAVVHAKTLDVLEPLGLTQDILKRGNQLTGWDVRDRKSVLAALDFSTLDCKYNMFVTLAQSETEALLRSKLEELGGSVYRSAEVSTVTDSGDKVQLEVNTPKSKTTVTASYVIAADGLKSTIREALDIKFEGGEYNASFVTTDCKMSSIGGLNKDAVQLFISTSGFLLFVPEPHDIWRIMATMDPAPKEQDISLWQRLADERALSGIEISELVWSSRFHIHHRLAREYRKGRIFLAGDAAHVHSPAGGQGMNIGLQDGFSLGQVLADAVREDKSSERDLNRYEMERRPVAKDVVSLTHSITTSALIKSPTLVVLRDWLMWAVASIPIARSYVTHRLAQLEH